MTITVDAIPFLQIGQVWPPASELGSDRLNRYAKNKSLFKGDHADVYNDTIRLLREDKQTTLEIALNFAGATSKLFADLLFGEPPSFRADDEAAQEWLNEFVAWNGLHQKAYKGALAQSYRGEAILKLRYVEGADHATVDVVPASIWFPVYDPDNVTEFQGHVLAWTKTIMEGNKERTYLRAEIHLPGWVHQRAWLLDEGKIKAQADLKTLCANPPLPDVETGVSEPLVLVVSNLELDDSPFGQDDYMEADTLFHQLDLRLAQIARVLDKHTDPNMRGPRLTETNPDTGEPQVTMGGRYFEYENDQPPPEYLVWDAQLQANFEYLDRILQGLYIATDTNAAAFSLATEGSVPSGSALKRLLMRPLARTNRKRIFWNAALPKLFALAAQLERAKGKTAPENVKVSVAWQNGLPDDPMEQTQIEQIRTGNKATSSVKSAIKRLDGVDDETAERELEEIAADEAQNQPPATTGAQFNFGQTGQSGEVV